ncbi:MAG: alpha/beta hydrolase fold family protein 17 [Achromobacter mucicolens]|jgi:(E)-2-((N-methylformamido)methylene)succinate hydrolase|uniref:alpha/beta fold hydrolase n=1 Tax=Achromobacter mucicolens TaxID=1389922 RepID=UPI00242D4AD1|nr:alpha/beta fold hydrolase [Achromobacter mucicolens]MDF2862018.1 alpha/beta hydrolase fold family protein 17 [Achromobacter mucicolens]
MTMQRRRTGRGEPLILLHGVGLDHTLWDDLAPMLEPDFDVLRYDLLGHGAAPALRGPADIQDFIAQLDAELDRAGWQQATVLGYSMGGLIAGAYAAARPERVSRLVLLNTVFRRTDEEAAAVRARLDAAATQDPEAAAKVSLTRWFTPAFQAAHPARVAQIEQRLLGNDRESFLSAYALFALGDPLLAQAAPDIACPVLVMTGEHDVGSNPRMTRDLARALPRACARVAPGQRHMLPVEEPGTVAAALRSFVSAHPAVAHPAQSPSTQAHAAKA